MGTKQANFIFDLVDKFAGYGFNKSHAAAYALLSYQTAWLKGNYPAEFMAAIMTLDQGNTDKLNIFYEECKKRGLKMLPPCVNHSAAEFMPEQGGIRYSLAALKNIGTQAALDIFEERQGNGPFRSLGDFARRLPPGTVNKRALEMLTSSGAFDSFNEDRGRVHANVDRIMETAQRVGADRATGQNDLFGGGGEGAGETEPADILLRSAPRWGLGEQLAKELEAVGFYISGHPLDEYETILKKMKLPKWSEFEQGVGKEKTSAKIAAMVLYKQVRRSKSGNKFAFAGFSDQTGQFESVLFSDLLISTEEILVPGKAVLLRVEAEILEGQLRTRIQSAELMDVAASRMQLGLVVELEHGEGLARLAELTCTSGRGSLRLRLHLKTMAREVDITLGRRIRVSPALADEIRALPGVLSVRELDAPRVVKGGKA